MDIEKTSDTLRYLCQDGFGHSKRYLEDKKDTNLLKYYTNLSKSTPSTSIKKKLNFIGDYIHIDNTLKDLENFMRLNPFKELYKKHDKIRKLGEEGDEIEYHEFDLWQPRFKEFMFSFLGKCDKELDINIPLITDSQNSSNLKLAYKLLTDDYETVFQKETTNIATPYKSENSEFLKDAHNVPKYLANLFCEEILKDKGIQERNPNKNLNLLEGTLTELIKTRFPFLSENYKEYQEKNKFLNEYGDRLPF